MAFAKGDFARYFGQLVAQPFFQIIEDGLCIFLTQSSTGLGRLAPCLFFHTIQLRNPLDGLLGNGGTLCGKHIDKLASDVGHAGHFRGFTFTAHAVETGIAIRMHPALITRQVLDRVLTLSIHCELIPNAGRCPSSTAGQIVCLCACGARAGPWSFVSDIGPDAGCLGLFVSWG